MGTNTKAIEKDLVNIIINYAFPNPNGIRDKVRRFSATRILLKNKNEPLCDFMWFDDIDIVALIMDIEKNFKIKIEDDYYLRNVKNHSLCATTFTNLVNIVESMLKIKKENKNESKKRFRK